ncbi:MAG: 50S ribosomal protein L17 [bacterium]
MRHLKKGKILGRAAAPRNAMMRNLITSFILHEKVVTSLAKAKYLRPMVEKVITMGKKDTLHNRRNVLKIVYIPSAAKKMFEVIGPKFKEVNGGYTRIIKLPRRLGDAAEMAQLELVEKK